MIFSLFENTKVQNVMSNWPTSIIVIQVTLKTNVKKRTHHFRKLIYCFDVVFSFIIYVLVNSNQMPLPLKGIEGH